MMDAYAAALGSLRRKHPDKHGQIIEMKLLGDLEE